MGVDFARRVRSRLLRRGLVRRRLSTAACVVLVATSVTVPAVAAIAADSNGQGTSLPGAAATNRLSAVTAAPTLPIKYVESASGANVDVRPNITVPPAPKVKTEVAGLRTERSATYENPNGTFSLQLGSGRVNYKDAAGAWQPIDTTLVADPGPAKVDSIQIIQLGLGISLLLLQTFVRARLVLGNLIIGV